MRVILAMILTTAGAFAQSSPHVYVVNKAGNSVSIVNAGTFKVEHTVPVGNNPHEISVAPDQSKLYVPNAGGNSVSVIDLKSNTETKKIEHPDFNSPHGVAFTPDSKRVVVTSERSKKIFILDAATDKVLRVIDTNQGGTHMAIVNKAGTMAYLTNRESNTVSFLDLNSYQIVADVAVGRGAEGFALSPNEKEIWVGNRNDGTLSVIDVAQRKVLATLPGGSNPIRVQFTPDGKYVLFPDGGSVTVFDAATRKQIQSVRMGSNPGGLIVSTDGKKVFVSCQGANEVDVIDTQTWTITNKIAVGAGPDGIAYR
jgi:YVTN family beta-propeller protein